MSSATCCDSDQWPVGHNAAVNMCNLLSCASVRYVCHKVRMSTFGILYILTAISRWTCVSRCLLKQRMMEVVVTGAVIRTKLQSNHHHQQTNTQFFLHAGCPSCRPTNSVKALKGKYHIPWTCLPQAQLGSSNFVSDH